MKERDEIERAIAIETGQWKTNMNRPGKVGHYEHPSLGPAVIARGMRIEAIASGLMAAPSH
jgi:hypothetical protein